MQHMRLNIGVKALQYITVRFKCVIKAHGFIFIISVTGRRRDLFQFVKKNNCQNKFCTQFGEIKVEEKKVRKVLPYKSDFPLEISFEKDVSLRRRWKVSDCSEFGYRSAFATTSASSDCGVRIFILVGITYVLNKTGMKIWFWQKTGSGPLPLNQILGRFLKVY